MPSGFSGNTAIFGIELVIESNLSEALDVALGVFPNCSNREAGSLAPPVYVVLAADHDTHTPAREHRICGKQLHIADDGIRLLADGDRGHAHCSFRVDAIGSALFRETIITAALFLATQRGRIPVHASAVMIGDRAIVLAGRSGSGKSTLALAADRAGLAVLAEDTVFVQLKPVFRLWGLAEHIHVFEKDAPPGKGARVRWRAGRRKYALPVSDVRLSAGKAVLCVIVRGARVGLNPFPLADAMHALSHGLEPGYDLFATHMQEAIAAIAAGGCWQLTLSDDPDAAIAAILDMYAARSADRQDA